MAETDARRQRELVAVRLEPCPELLGRRLARGGDVLGEELHLLRHAALDDRVVLVESQRERFAIEDLFAHLVFDQLSQLLRRRVAPPLRPEHQNQLRKVVDRQPNLF